MRLAILFCMVMMATTILSAQPPYSGTIFFDPDIITSSDPSAIQSVTYSGRKDVTMYDRRVPDWVTVNAYLFDVVWDDAITSVAQVNPEFGDTASARVEAEKYAFLIGQLPACLRKDVDEIWIHKGVEPFGGGNRSILIHTGQSALYEKDGIIEETLVHEASHTSLDAAHANNSDWKKAQSLDGNFISTYAQSNPTREDIAESFLTWLAVRFREDKISEQDYNKITQAIPNRLKYFDAIHFDLYPFAVNSLNISTFGSRHLRIYPNPTSDFVYLDSNEEINGDDIKIYNLIGQDFTSRTTYENGKLNLSALPAGNYLTLIKAFVGKVCKL